MTEYLYRCCSFEEIEQYIKTGKLTPLNYGYVSLSENQEIGEVMMSPLHKLQLTFDKQKLIELGAIKVEYTANWMAAHHDVFMNITDNTVVSLNTEEFGEDDIMGTEGYEDIRMMMDDYLDGNTDVEAELSQILENEFGSEEEWVIREDTGSSKSSSRHYTGLTQILCRIRNRTAQTTFDTILHVIVYRKTICAIN